VGLFSQHPPWVLSKEKPLNRMTEHHVIDLSALASARDGSGHSIFSPSGSPMWLWCSGSLIPNILADDEAGFDAAWGAVAHELTEHGLKTGRLPTHRIGENVFIESGDWGYLIDIDDEMMAHVQTAVDYCEWLPGDHFVEQRVYFSEYTPLKNQSGTADHVACAPGVMTITDHKFGKGVRVYAAMNPADKRAVIHHLDDSFEINGNSQGLLYALGFFLKWDHKYNFQRIIIRISQPCLDHFDEWETTREELLAFGEFVRRRSAAAWTLNAPRRPSPKACQWCKVKSTCAALAVQQEAIMRGAFGDLIDDISVESMSDLKERLSDPLGSYELQPVKLATLTIGEMAMLYSYRSAAESWWKKLEQTLYSRALEGETVPGYKLVESRSNRVVKNKREFVEFLVAHGVPREDAVEEKVVSPADAEKLLRKAGVRAKDLPTLLQPLVFKPKGKATLAPNRDKRPALEDASGFAFEDLTSTPETED
jgi:hypothetical protein